MIDGQSIKEIVILFVALVIGSFFFCTIAAYTIDIIRTMLREKHKNDVVNVHFCFIVNSQWGDADLFVRRNFRLDQVREMIFERAVTMGFAKFGQRSDVSIVSWQENN